MHKSLLFPLVFAFGLAIAACGNDDSSAPATADAPSDATADDDGGAESTTTAGTEEPSEETGADSSSDESAASGTATVKVAGSVHEFTEAETCEIGAAGSAQAAPTNPAGRTAEAMFTDGNDAVFLFADENSIGGNLTLDGLVWEGYGRAPLLEVTDAGAVWTGEMSSDGGESLEEVTISISC